MAARLIWSPRAVRDLAAVETYLIETSSYYTASVIGRFFERADLLCHQPLQGRFVPEHQGTSGYREVFVHRWRMIYRVGQDVVEIVAIIHGARLISNTDPL
jgi:toxin ParE1/3/4